MTSPSLDIIWRISEAEAAHACYPEITPAHFLIGSCKAVDGLRQKTQETKKKAALAINLQEDQHQHQKQIYFYDR